MTCNELTVRAHEMSLAVKTWGDQANPAIIALHGWQDNAGTFDKLAPLLPDYYWIVPDLPGHGKSEHRGKGAEYTLWAYCTEVMALADAMSLESFNLVGHSMGGGIASLLAGLYPERISKLVLLDIIGVLTSAPEAIVTQMRAAVQQRVEQPLRKAGLYSSLELAIAARAKRGVTTEAAGLLAARGVEKGDAGFYWSQDQRLTLNRLLSLTEAQMTAFLQAIDCPVLVIASREAVGRKAAIQNRVAMVKNIQLEQLTGGHHQHLDGDVATIASLTESFLAKTASS